MKEFEILVITTIALAVGIAYLSGKLMAKHQYRQNAKQNVAILKKAEATIANMLAEIQ